MLAATLVVLLIAREPSDPLSLAFESAAHGVLGEDASIQMLAVDGDPPDDESAARSKGADGVVELSWTADGSRARIHCYISGEARWVDREVSFGASSTTPEREASERGRLLGFAAATMFTQEARSEQSGSDTPAKPPDRVPSKPPAPTRAPDSSPRRTLEFAAIASSGLNGAAAGIGATAALRLALTGPLWARGFLTGRTGDVPEAQAATHTALLGAGVALAALPASSRFALGARVDAFASYFEASHLSEDDAAADTRSRWLPGADLVGEGGFRFAGSAGLFAGLGVEAMFGETELYTHGNLVAVVPPFRIIGELGFRTGF